jgi:hypothetical protein
MLGGEDFMDVMLNILDACCYSFLDPMFAGRLTKSTERNFVFFETLFELFSALFILPLYYQNHQVFLC